MISRSTEGWEAIAAERQNAVLESIPPEWRLPQDLARLHDVRHIAAECNLLTPQQVAITEKTASELLQDLAQRRLSSVEVTKAFCARAAIAHQLVNCLTGIYYDEAVARAAELDSILETTGRTVGPLHGLPIAIKDIFMVKGKRATFGLVAWANTIRDADASIVKLLKAAGAVQFASTAMPQAGMMLQTVSPLWGRTLNPFNPYLSAGGSSGGDGALVAMKGSSFCPSTDIGGSIRAPAAFNGLYAIRPTADRIPKFGMMSPAAGQNSIKVSCGPTCHSVDDIELVTKLLVEHAQYIGYEPTAASIPWRSVSVQQPLVVALLKTDGVVMPQPPVLRALSETAMKLRSAGHTVIEIEPPIDFWEAALVTWKLYFQTGGKEVKSLTASTGEPLNECFEWYLNTFNIGELTVPQLFETNRRQNAIKREFAEWWASTAHSASIGRPIDAIICPAAPSASFPHEYAVWWGYFSIWNLLDYPSTIVPLKSFAINPEKDIKDATYVPRGDNPFDSMNQEIYDPVLWKGAPMSIQVVRQQYQDEELVAVTRIIDGVLNSVPAI